MRICFFVPAAVFARLLPFLLIPLAAILLLVCLTRLFRAARRSFTAEKAAQEAAMEQDNELFPPEIHEARVTGKYQDIGPDPRYPASIPHVRHMITFAYDGQEKTFAVPEERFQAITLYAVGTLILQDGAFLDFDVLCDGVIQTKPIAKDQKL
ncbi:MAG: hypothetical protein IJT76_08285 [Clostridia bacterium]|nr:hypothetical protein [Clostridia bacterium]